MSTTEQVQIPVPTDSDDRERLRKGVQEIVDSMVRKKGEEEFQKEAAKNLSEGYDINKKYINRMAREYFKDEYEQKSSEQDQFETLFETIMLGKESDEIDEPEDED